MLASKIKWILKSSFYSTLFLISALGEAEVLFKGSGLLKMAGGAAHISFMQEIGAKLSQQNPDFKLLVAGGGSGVGVQKLGAGLVDLANTGRPLSQEEKKRFQLVSYPLAYDAITFIVNPENPVSNLSFSDLQKIFSGEIKTWDKWIKGSKQPIHVYVRDEASGTQDIFLERVLKNKALVKSANFTNSPGAMKLAIANDRFGIGFVGFGYLEGSVKGLRLNGHKVNARSIREKRYPLVRVLYVNAPKKQNTLVKEFISYLRGPESADVMSKWGLVPVYNARKKKPGVSK